MRLIVISDLHVAAGPLDDCDAELEACLCNFLSVAGERPTELVLNGDFLDFLKAPPLDDVSQIGRSAAGELMLGCQEQHSLAKLQQISHAHPRLFDCLRRFTASEGCRLVVMPGNHDVDLYWPGVQAALWGLVQPSPSERARVETSVAYRPTCAPGVLIEHGHRYDDVNWFLMRPAEPWDGVALPIQNASDGVERLLSCPGSFFVTRYINQLNAEYPCVDHVSPFSSFLGYLLHAGLTSPRQGLRALLACWAMLKFVSESLAEPLSEEALLGYKAASGETTTPLAVTIADRIGALPANQQADLLTVVRSEHPGVDMPLLMWLQDPVRSTLALQSLADHLGAVPEGHPAADSLLGLGGTSSTLSLERAWRRDECAALREGASRHLSGAKIHTVVMGHTHVPETGDGDAGYLNTGSWTRTLRVERKSTEASLARLRAPVATLPYSLRYYECDGRGGGVKVFQARE